MVDANIKGETFSLKNNNKIKKTVEAVDENMVYFTDSSRISTDSFETKFVKYENIEDDMNRAEQLMRGISVGESDDFNVRKIDIDDPRSKMTPQIDYNNYNNQTNTQQSTDLSNAGLHPDTIRQIQEDQERQKQKQMLVNNPQADPGLAGLFGIGGEPAQAQQNIPQQQHQQQHQQQYVSKLPKMKYTQKIVINLELNEMIPKVEDIKAVENVFDISVVEELAKEISTRLLSNPVILEGMIIAELEKLTKKTKKTTVKKPLAKKAVTKIKKVVGDGSED
jgi:hypothetical protein